MAQQQIAPVIAELENTQHDNSQNIDIREQENNTNNDKGENKQNKERESKAKRKEND